MRALGLWAVVAASWLVVAFITYVAIVKTLEVQNLLREKEAYGWGTKSCAKSLADPKTLAVLCVKKFKKLKN